MKTTKKIFSILILLHLLFLSGVASVYAKKSAEDMDLEINDKVEVLNERLATVVNLAMDGNLNLLTETQKKNIKSELKRSQNASVRMKRDKVVKEMGKKRKYKDDESTLSSSELYLQPVVPEDEYDTEMMEDFSAMLDDLNSLMDEAATELTNLVKVVQLEQSMDVLKTAGVDYADPYKNLEEHIEWVSQAVYAFYEVLQYAAVAAGGTYDIAACITRQTVPPGVNTSAAGVWSASIKLVCDGLAEACEIALDIDKSIVENAEQKCILQIGKEHWELLNDMDDINGQLAGIKAGTSSTGDNVDALLVSAATMDGKINGIEDTTDVIEDKIDVLTTKVDAMNEQMDARLDALTVLLNQRIELVEQLLCTPQGARPNFSPKK